MLKKFITIFLLFSATIMAVSYLLPDKFVFSKRLETLSDAEITYEYLSDLRNWGIWAPWVVDESVISENIFEGESGKVNHRWDWRSSIKGTGSVIITRLDSLENLIELEVIYTAPVSLRSTYTIEIEEMGNGSHINFSASGLLSFPLGRIFGFFLQSALEKELDKSSEKLKLELDKLESRSMNEFNAGETFVEH
jgi:hypothetical protein